MKEIYSLSCFGGEFVQEIFGLKNGKKCLIIDDLKRENGKLENV